jgi:osmotically-inducible protein OsmY
MPKGRVSLNAERGRVFLRGEVDDPDLIEALEAAVRRVRGVKDVESLLHLPGTPAPTSSAGDVLRERRGD